jgi:hypothetical protein
MGASTFRLIICGSRSKFSRDDGTQRVYIVALFGAYLGDRLAPIHLAGWRKGEKLCFEWRVYLHVFSRCSSSAG